MQQIAYSIAHVFRKLDGSGYHAVCAYHLVNEDGETLEAAVAGLTARLQSIASKHTKADDHQQLPIPSTNREWAIYGAALRATQVEIREIEITVGEES